MSLLCDTHIFLALAGGGFLEDKKLIRLIDSYNGHKFLSIVSLWEIAIKINVGKLQFKEGIEEVMRRTEEYGFHILQVNNKHILTYTQLPLIHRDPFDRMIIAQAATEKMQVLTDDKIMQSYPEVTFFA